jgi:hypothetical protein
MSVSIKTKREAVATTFGVPVDPEDVEVEYINFMYARRNLATVPDRGMRDLAYVHEITDLEMAIDETLARIRERDGEKIFREAATYLRDAVDSASERRQRARGKANGAAHV